MGQIDIEDCTAKLMVSPMLSYSVGIACTEAMAVLFDMLVEHTGQPVMCEDGAPSEFQWEVGTRDPIDHDATMAGWASAIGANTTYPWSVRHWLEAHIMSLPRDRWESMVVACMMFLREHGRAW